MATSFSVISKIYEWLEDRNDLICLRKARAEDDGVRFTHEEALEELAKIAEQGSSN